MVRRPRARPQSLPRFVLAVGALYVLFQLAFAAWIVGSPPLEALLAVNARLAAGLLRLVGHPVLAVGTQLHGPAASVEVQAGCDGLQPVVLLAIAVGLFRASPRSKLWMLGLGALALFALNLARITSLFLLQVHWPSGFELAHLTVWPFVFMGAVLGLWFAWARRELAPRASGGGA